MASDSEPRKKFLRPPRGPLRSHISGRQKACKATSDMTQLELKLANSNGGSCILVVFSAAPVEKVYFRCVLMMKPQRACTHGRQSFVSRRLSILIVSN